MMKWVPYSPNEQVLALNYSSHRLIHFTFLDYFGTCQLKRRRFTISYSLNWMEAKKG